MMKSFALAIAASALATPASAGVYACLFKGQPLMLIDTSFDHARLTIGKDSAPMQAGNGFLTAEINDQEYIFKLGPRGPDDPKITVALTLGDYRGEAVCARR